jgi:hypothetical protein
MNMRGVYGTSTARHVGSPRAAKVGFLGIHWTMHPIDDRVQVVKLITNEAGALYNELVREMGANPADLDYATMYKDPSRFALAHAKIEKSALFPIWRDVLSPFLKEWNDFARDFSGWSEFIWLTSWDKLVSYTDRWHAVYDKVANAISEHGGKLLAPPPQEIPKDVLDKIGDFLKKGAEKTGDFLEELGTMGKVAIYGGLAIGGLLVLSSIVTNVRNRQDPMAPYLAMRHKTA